MKHERFRTRIAFTVFMLLAGVHSSVSLATPRATASIHSVNPGSKSSLHVTLRTQEGIERFVFAPRGEQASFPNESHFVGYARSRNFQTSPLPAALSMSDGRAWLFYTSRRTNRPVAVKMAISQRGTDPDARPERVSRAPRQALGCATEAEHSSDPSLSPPQQETIRTRRTSQQASLLSERAGRPLFSPPRVLDVATAADYDFYLKHGDETNSYIRAVLNAADAVYARSLGVRLRIVQQTVATTGERDRTPTSAYQLLNEFRIDSFAMTPRADARHLFTGRSLENSIIGIAYVGAVCILGGNFGVGLSRNVNPGLQPYLAAHEIAHNLSATHDQARGSIMNPSINSSNSRFSAAALSDMREFISTVGKCLSKQQLGAVTLRVGSKSKLPFVGGVTFETATPSRCTVKLYGSEDKHRFYFLAAKAVRTKGASRTSSVSFSTPKVPKIASNQPFYFNASVSCGGSTKKSEIKPMRFQDINAALVTSSQYSGVRWLRQLRSMLD